ncbi:MAG: hypothetical protein ACI4RA_09805 [Kiritimatiellia bacterium]
MRAGVLGGLFSALSLTALASPSATNAVAAFSPDRRPDVVWRDVGIYHDLAYGPRDDAPGEGADYGPGVRWHSNGCVFHAHRTGQRFDVFVAAKTGFRPDAPVYVNLHGGAWCQPFDKDGESFAFFKLLVDRGFIVVNANYQLQNDVTDGTRRLTRRPNAAFRDMLRDIDDLGSFLKNDFLPRVGVTAQAYALGGTSAGAHLATLYAYDQDNPASPRLGLRHDFRVGFVVDIVGPVDLAGEDFTEMLLERKLPFGSTFNAWAVDRLVTLLGWLVEDDLRACIEAGDGAGVRRALAAYSPIRLVTPRSVPTILAYCQVYPFAKTDGCVPTSSYHDLCARLKEAGVPYAGDIRTFRPHGQLGTSFTIWLADRIVEFERRGYLKERKRK